MYILQNTLDCYRQWPLILRVTMRHMIWSLCMCQGTAVCPQIRLILNQKMSKAELFQENHSLIQSCSSRWSQKEMIGEKACCSSCNSYGKQVLLKIRWSYAPVLANLHVLKIHIDMLSFQYRIGFGERTLENKNSLDEACPLKRVRLSLWQQHLKNFGQSEGIEPVSYICQCV